MVGRKTNNDGIVHNHEGNKHEAHKAKKTTKGKAGTLSQPATMERFIKRREKKVTESESDENENGGEMIGHQKPRKKKAQFAFNICDMTHDNLPALSDDENIIMQLNIHPDLEANKVRRLDVGACVVQDADSEMHVPKKHMDGSCHLFHDSHPQPDPSSLSDPSPYDIFENNYLMSTERSGAIIDTKEGQNMNGMNEDRKEEIKEEEKEKGMENEAKNNDMNDIEMLKSKRQSDIEHICEMQEVNEESQDFNVVKLLKDFNDKNKHNEWPLSTHISCFWCCHKFFNAPFGIPVKYSDDKFHVFGCFCGLECALAYNLSMKDQIDEMWERCNLLNLLCRKTHYNKNGFIKPAPPRLSLKMFGGYLSIEEFRSFSNKNKMLNINFPPMQTITQQIEEINECDINHDLKFIPIDTDRINKYKEKMRLKRTKPLNDTRNTLDSAVNIKITSMNG